MNSSQKKEVSQMIDQSMHDMYASLRKGGVAFAARVDKIKSALSAKCDNDTSSDTGNLEIPAHVATMLDALRVDRPQAFEALVQAAETLAKTEPMERADVLPGELDRLISSV